MAARYWVGGTGTWDSSTTTHWSASSGGAGGASVPGTGDTVTINSSSGTGTITLSVSPTIQTLSLVGYAGTLAWGTNTISLNSTGIVFQPDSTYTQTGTPSINIITGGSTAISVKPNGIPAVPYNLTITGGSYAFTFDSSVNSSYLNNLVFSSFTGSVASSGYTYIAGNLTIPAGISIFPGNFQFVPVANGSFTVDTNNVALTNVIFNSSGYTATWTFLSNYTGVSGSTSFNAGSYNFNGKTISVNALSVGSNSSITFNGSTLAVSGSATFNASSTLTAGTGSAILSMTSASSKTLTGGGKTFPLTLSNDGAGTLTITGANTFNGITNTVQPTAFVFPSSTTQTVTNWNVSGTSGNLVTITSSIAGTAATLSKSSGTVSSNYLSLKDSTATGGASWYAGANSTNVSNNTGWIFTAPPGGAVNGNFFFMF